MIYLLIGLLLTIIGVFGSFYILSDDKNLIKG